MKVVSLVPSWTETLIEAGVEVVGRTRFCIHPQEIVGDIPALGGTKGVDFTKIKALKPDLVLMDRDENTIEMAQNMPAPIFATHVRSIADCIKELTELSSHLSCIELQNMAKRYQAIISERPMTQLNWDLLPGVISWWKPVDGEKSKFVYVIWKKPWMAASGSGTFIGSMFEMLGWGGAQESFAEPYPKIHLNDFDPKHTVLLFSSEPYPFARERDRILREISFPCALVDGESFSWFGIRALRFLESCFQD